jgi:hypothetical protein
MHRRSFLGMLSAGAIGSSQNKEAALNRPKVPGTLSLRARRRTNTVSEATLRWEVAETAIIVAICGTLTPAACRRSVSPQWPQGSIRCSVWPAASVS